MLLINLSSKSHVLKFQREYNKFVDENKDMCEEDSTKEELHQRVEDLYQLLWEMIENKYLPQISLKIHN